MYADPEQQKLGTRPFWEDFNEAIKAHRHIDLGKHGLRLGAQKRWNTASTMPRSCTIIVMPASAGGQGAGQRLLSAACQNMKKIALLLARKAATLFAKLMSKFLIVTRIPELSPPTIARYKKSRLQLLLACLPKNHRFPNRKTKSPKNRGAGV